MIVTIDGPMINKFVEDIDYFNKCADERFKKLDIDEDGVLSRDDFPKGSLGRWLLAMDLEPQSDEDIKKAYDSVFEKFDAGNNSIDLDKFRSMLREIMRAVARGIGNTPVNILLDDDSLLLKACAQNN